VRETGIVVEVLGDKARVCFQRSSACGKCGACGMTDDQKEIVFEAANEAEASVGDHVWVELPDRKVLHAATLAYALNRGLETDIIRLE